MTKLFQRIQELFFLHDNKIIGSSSCQGRNAIKFLQTMEKQKFHKMNKIQFASSFVHCDIQIFWNGKILTKTSPARHKREIMKGTIWFVCDQENQVIKLVGKHSCSLFGRDSYGAKCCKGHTCNLSSVSTRCNCINYFVITLRGLNIIIPYYKGQ